MTMIGAWTRNTNHPPNSNGDPCRSAMRRRMSPPVVLARRASFLISDCVLVLAASSSHASSANALIFSTVIVLDNLITSLIPVHSHHSVEVVPYDPAPEPFEVHELIN